MGKPYGKTTGTLIWNRYDKKWQVMAYESYESYDHFQKWRICTSMGYKML
jgi:hypothetical protein